MWQKMFITWANDEGVGVQKVVSGFQFKSSDVTARMITDRAKQPFEESLVVERNLSAGYLVRHGELSYYW